MNLRPTIPFAEPAPSAPQLTPEHLRQVAVAREAVRKIRRAVSVAQFDGVTLAVFAAITALMSLTSPTGLAVGLGMGLAAFVELRGVTGLRKLDPRAARTLGVNQLGVATVLILYCLWKIRAELTGHGEFAAEVAEIGATQLLGDYADMARTIVMAVYGAVIAVAVFAQGGLALYYFSRRRHIESYLAQTPPWVVELQRAGGEL